MSIQKISKEQLRRMGDQEGLVLQGCGGDPQEWLDGINQILTDEGILKKGTRFEEAYTFQHDGVTCLLFPFKEGMAIEMGRLAMWRLQTHPHFGGTWLSDYVPNRLGGFLQEQKQRIVKPDCPLIGQNGNIMNLIGIAGRTLREHGIEPCKNYAASTSGNYVDNDVTVDGSGSTRGSNVWYAMPESYREAIALVLLYSRQKWDSSYTVSNTSMANNPNVPLRIATQFLIYEIVTGLRDPDTFVRNSTNGYTSGVVFYNAGVSNVSGFASNYNSLVSSVQEAMKIPSFTSAESYNAPTITMTGTSTTVTDSNGVLSNFTFSNGNGASFSKSGNSLTITQTGTISQSTVFSASRYLPSAANSSFAIYYSSSSTYQTCVKLYSPSSGNLNAYFKLRAPDPGAISLTKTTEDGKNLSGWRFGVYSDSACTSLVSGPHTTDSSGKISVTGLLAGTYYVKELGHTDSSINALYTCASTNPQKVTVTSGGTAAVSFVNKLKTGSVSLTKTTEDGKNLSGWQFGIYSNSACTTLVSGPHTTDTSGKISVTGLTPGTYYVKEIGHTDSAINALYYCASANPQSMTVTSGAATFVSFTNKLNTGGVKLVKTTNTGENLGGWQIGLYTDSACTSPVTGSPFTTGEDGTVTVTGLLPGALYAKELAGSDP